MNYGFLPQPYLISGQNIKTVAGESLLGSGDVDVVTNADLLAARPGVHPDDDELFEFVDGNPGDGGSGTPYDFGTFATPALFTLDMGTF